MNSIHFEWLKIVFEKRETERFEKEKSYLHSVHGYNTIEGTEGWGGVALSNLGISAQASGGIRLLHQKKKT